MRFMRSWSVPLLSLLSLLSPSTISAAVFGEAGVSNPQMTWTGGPVRCNNNVVRYEWVISQTDSSMNGAKHQPMAESGLPTVVLSFNANILKVAQSAPSQSTTTISGNQLTQNVVDDGPNVVQELTFQGITCANFGTLLYSMSATAPATGTTAPLLPFPIKGTAGFSATPVTVGTVGGNANNNNNNNGGAVTPAVTPATQAPAAQTPVVNTNGNQNIVKFTGGFNGNGCFGAGAAILQFQIQESIDGGKTFTLPMAEKGLPTVTVTFSNPVTSTGTTFNVANSVVAGNTWTFTLQDDQPNVGAGLSFAGVTCTGGQFSMRPTYKISAQVNGQQWAVIGTGAAGFVAGNGAITPAVVPPPAPTPATTAINKNTFGTAMVKNAVQKFTLGGTNCWTQNNQVKAVLQFSISQTDSGSPNTPHGPMSETGLPDVTITFGAPVTVSGTFNVANSQSAGTSWKFTEQNDQPIVGGQFTFGAGVTCTNGQLSNNGAQFTFSISAKANGVTMPTTSNSPGFKALGAENLLDDGSATVDMANMNNTNNGTTVPIAVIAGAIAGGVVVLIIASLLVIRYRRQKQQTSPSAPAKVAWYVGNENKV